MKELILRSYIKTKLNKMVKYLLLFGLLISSQLVVGQQYYYSAPVKIPMLLSGSFAELRNNHFHSGIDIKTQGKIGIPVFSVADGFISRISVSPSGFGKAIYIDHYNGTTSVYGHLYEFREDIAGYIKEIQYKKKSFKLDISVPHQLFLVEKNELIGKSGNSGSSAGPHLHFEIRDTKSEEPLNPLKFGFDIIDNSPPKIFSMQIVPLSENAHVDFQTSKKGYPVVFSGGKYRLENNPVIPLFGETGFAIENNDFLDGSANQCGINSMELIIDGELFFLLNLDRFSFNESRFINSYIDFGEYIQSKTRFQKTWIEPGNLFSGYKFEKNRGIINFSDDKKHLVEIVIKDSYENSSTLEFWVESKFREVNARPTEFSDFFKFDQNNHFKKSDIEIEITKGSLYTNLKFNYLSTTPPEGFLSNFHQIHRNTVPLHNTVNLSIKTKPLENHLQEKALLVSIDEISGKISAEGGSYQNGWIKAGIRSFGTYAVFLDTIPPTILPLSIVNRNTLNESGRIRFKIRDDLAGIERIEGTIDGKWALFDYDAKNDIIVHYFDHERFELKKRHDFKLTITDFKNNISTYEATFWK